MITAFIYFSFLFLSFSSSISPLVAIHDAELKSRGQTDDGRLAPHALISILHSSPHWAT
ncbi:hypothetical protein FA13DRAFT_1726398 [Coprinellus micaceus]|uniref:Secreted protein n=1 Tax=Coprinellus micaceus TaxID=71717 RepID=A0A4Y7TT17_COPMI|nr:hypothetical protein FA13DRAFT_1726398 [Coprinellus micaceus]